MGVPRVFFSLALVLLLSTAASADVTSVLVDSSVPLGQFGERAYLEIKGTMAGTVARKDGSSGTYRVPLVIDYPADPGQCNGFGMVEPLHQSRARLALATIGAGYLFGNGYIHASVAWDKTDANSNGGVGQLSDGWQIVRDAASLLRKPGGAYAGLAAEPCAAKTIVAFGLSRTGILLRGLVASGRNHDLLFDGLLITEAGDLGLALDGTKRSTVRYPSPLPGDGKVIAVNTEHDVERFQGWGARVEDDTDSYRVYEVAGAPHVWKGNVDFAFLGATRQNPLNAGPVYKAMLSHLHDWITDDEEPPPSVALPGKVVAPPDGDLVPRIGCADLSPCPIFQFVRDGNGNAEGGVQIPTIAAPLGTYLGVETNLAGVSPFVRDLVSYGGAFVPFDSGTLSALYGTHGAYVNAVARAADTARGAGWILPEDAEAYVSDAAQGTVGKPAPGDDAGAADWGTDSDE